MMLVRDKDFAVRSNAAYCTGRRVADSENRELDAAALEIARNEAIIPQLSLLNGPKSEQRTATADCRRPRRSPHNAPVGPNATKRFRVGERRVGELEQLKRTLLWPAVRW